MGGGGLCCSRTGGDGCGGSRGDFMVKRRATCCGYGGDHHDVAAFGDRSVRPRLVVSRRSCSVVASFPAEICACFFGERDADDRRRRIRVSTAHAAADGFEGRSPVHTAPLSLSRLSRLGAHSPPFAWGPRPGNGDETDGSKCLLTNHNWARFELFARARGLVRPRSLGLSDCRGGTHRES